jgi:HEAT repeat protein
MQAADPEEIALLVMQLGAAKFQLREEAGAKLRNIGSPAIPALSLAVTSKNAEVRSRADQILLEIDPIWRNSKSLRSGNLAKRREAIRNVVGYRDPRILDTVLAQLPTETNRDCFDGLLAYVAYLGDHRAASVLTEYLLHPSQPWYVDDAVLRALAAIADAREAPAMRAYCARHVKKMPRPGDKAFESYWGIAGVRGNDVLADALGAVADPEGVMPLLLMNTVQYDGIGGAHVYRMALRALVKIGPKAAPELIHSLDLFDGTSGPRIFARKLIVEAIGKVGNAAAIPALERALGNSPLPVVCQAAIALDRLGSDKGAAWVLARVAASDKSKLESQELWYALEALRACKHVSLKKTCTWMVTEDQPWRRWHAAEALARMGEKAGFEFFHEQLKDPDAMPHAVFPLIELGDETCLPVLIQWARSSTQAPVQTAMRALSLSATPMAVQTLIDLANGPEREIGYARVKRDAIGALGRVRTRQAVVALIVLLDNREPDIRELAMSSLTENVGVRLVGVERWKTWWDYHKETFRR